MGDQGIIALLAFCVLGVLAVQSILVAGVNNMRESVATIQQDTNTIRQRQVLAERCSHLYNVGRHRDWAECMGVGYVR